MQEIRDIDKLDIPVEEKYYRIVDILPDLRDHFWFKDTYISSKSLDYAICYTIYAKEYLSIYDLEYLLDLTELYVTPSICEAIYQKSEDKIATYNLLNSKLYDHEFLYYGFIRSAIRENNKPVYSEIITKGNTDFIDEEDELHPNLLFDMLRRVTRTAYESNNKEFIRWFIEYTGYEASKILLSCVMCDVEADAFLIKVLSEGINIDELVKCKLTPYSEVFQSFMLAGASREILTSVYGDSKSGLKQKIYNYGTIVIINVR